MRSVNFDYRLPVTFVRATGTISTSTDVTGKVTTDRRVTVTTELGADMRTTCHVSLDARSLATQKATWNLTADGRLTGADVSLTAQPLARWTAGLQLGGTVAGIAGPALLAAGPPGWLGLAGLVGVATVGGAAVAGGLGRRASGESGDSGGPTLTAVRAAGDMAALTDVSDAPETVEPSVPEDASPAEWDVHATYVSENEEAAKELANLRSCLAVTARAHARAVRAAALAETAADVEYWEARGTRLRRLLAGASVAAAGAEARYAVWLTSKTTLKVESHDIRLPIDLLPSRSELEAWAAGGKVSVYSEWAASVADLGTAVSFDLVPPGDLHVEPNLELDPGQTPGEVHYRPPRQALLRVWKATPVAEGSERYTLELVEIRRTAVSCPGNEARISIETEHDVTNAVAVSFDESGALTKVATEVKDRAVERSAALSGLMTTIGESVAAGKDLREAVAPPSLTERAAEAKAAAELGLVPGKEDPLKGLKDQLEEAQLRAQLKLAEQIQASTSVPVFVAMSTTS